MYRKDPTPIAETGGWEARRELQAKSSDTGVAALWNTGEVGGAWLKIMKSITGMRMMCKYSCIREHDAVPKAPHSVSADC